MTTFNYTDDAKYGEDITKPEMAASIRTYNYLMDVSASERRNANMFKGFIFMIPVVYIVARIVIS